MPTLTFTVAASGDDVMIEKGGVSYPGPSSAAYPALATVNAVKDFSTPNYFTDIGLMRWNTGALLPSAATVTGAVLRVYLASFTNQESRNIIGDWTTWTGVVGDFADPLGTTAIAGTAMSTQTQGQDNDITLANASTNISFSGYTYMRVGLSGGAPTLFNEWKVAAYDNTSSFLPPRLIVTYVLPTSKVASIASSSGYSGTYTDARTDDANWLLGV